MSDISRAAAERVARENYGKLIATLAARGGDISAAEEALGDAFAEALRTWPERGLPDRPAAWLLTVARNRLTDRQRRALKFPETGEMPEIEAPLSAEGDAADNRLQLMLVCAHPAIPEDVHAPLMLQTVLGVEAAEIARAFTIPPATMAQRLVRAKKKIRDARIPFAIPEADVMAERLGGLREAIYAAHALDWLAPTDALGDEALYLADLLTKLAPDDAEALGLAALIAFTHARSAARVHGGRLVPLDQQDVALWDRLLIQYGQAALRRSHALGTTPARFQIEAAIQGLHIERAGLGTTDWGALDALHGALQALHPTLGGAVAHAAVIAKCRGARAGLDRLDALATSGAALENLQAYWATRARLLAEDGDRGAREAFDRALALTVDGPTRAYLEGERARLN